MIRRPTAAARTFEYERELFTYTFLADEIVETARPKRCLDGSLSAVGVRRDDVDVGGHARLSTCSERLRSTAMSGAAPSMASASACGPTAARASSTSRPVQPRPPRAERNWSRQMGAP